MGDPRAVSSEPGGAEGGLVFEVFAGDDLVVFDDVKVMVAGKGHLRIVFQGFR